MLIAPMQPLKFFVFMPLFLLTSTFVSYAQVPAADPYRDEPFILEQSDVTVRMKADATGERVNHVRMRIQSEGVARQFSVLNFTYAAADGTGIIDYVRVHKVDGSIVDTPVADAIEMPGEVTREAPVYSDIREKHLPIRSLAVGDELEYQFRNVTNKPISPNQFWGAEHLVTGGNVVLSQTLTLEAPASIYLQVWSPNHPVSPTVHDGVKIWKWTASQTKPSSRNQDGTMKPAEVKDPDEDADGRLLPSVAWTTFHNWAEVGTWYRSLIEPRMEPTAAVRVKADELTKAARTPDEQARALYLFVAENIRYVSISFGLGRIQPHAAADVLTNGYGDCKDKDTLLESLLRAKGFITAPVLIGAGIALVPDVPSPAVFNHEITTVELPGEGRVWLDSTAEVAPYRVLMPIIRDQQALVLTAKTPASLQKTPSDPPYAYRDRFESIMKLDSKGVLKGSVSLSLRSDSELIYRALIRQAAPAQWDSVMQYMSNAMDFGGKVSDADLRQSDPAGPVHITYNYTREDFADWKNDRIFANFPSLDVTTIDKDKAPDHDIDLGAPRTIEAHSEITLPNGDRAELPNAVHVDRPYMSFNKTYRLEDDRMIADRVLVVKQHRLSKDLWKDYLAFSKSAEWQDGEKYALLLPPSTVGTVAHPVEIIPGADDLENAPFETVEKYIMQCERSNDWSRARHYAERTLARFPQQPYAHSILAYIDGHDRKYDEAIAGYTAELAAHPDDRSEIIGLWANVYLMQKHYPQAIALLEKYSSRKELLLQQQLISAQTLNGDVDGALKTARDSLQDNPDNKNLQTEEARILQRLKRTDEAEQAAKRAIDGNDDPNLINSNVYVLAEMKRDLPFAEANSRRSIEMFDRQNVATTIDEANSLAFNLSAEMVAAWDTLGDILLMEGKAKEAEPYLAAAWFNRTDIAVGNHLAQAYEQLGRKSEARRIDELALSIAKNPMDTEDRAALVARDARLLNVNATAGKPETLQEQRTFHLKNTAAITGSGTVRVQLDARGVLYASLVSGDSSLKPLLGELHNISLPAAVPPASPAHLLRDATLLCGKVAKECDLVFMEHSGIAQERAFR